MAIKNRVEEKSKEEGVVSFLFSLDTHLFLHGQNEKGIYT